MTTRNTSERDKEIVRLYAEGISGPVLAERHGVTRQRIKQILKRDGAVNADEARVAQMKKRELEQQNLISDFLDKYGVLLRTLAEQHALRVDVEGKFALLEPDISNDILSSAIRRSGVIFDVNREEFNFGVTVIEAGVWHMMAAVNKLQGDVTTAIEEVSLDEMIKIADLSATAGLKPATVKSIIISVGSCRRRLAQDSSLTITKKRYDEERNKTVAELRISSDRRLVDWPPTSQTVMKRLGGNYWSDALASIGVSASTQGRSRGLLIFDEAQYRGAVQDFMEHCRLTDSTPYYDGYEVWVRHEDRAGRQRPSGPSVKLFYRTWTNAKRSSQDLVETPLVQVPVTTLAASVARTALHDADTSRRSILERLAVLPTAQRSAAAMIFVREYMSEFEVRRRLWLRSMISKDSGAVARRMNSEQLTRAHRNLLSASPPKVEEVLTDMYLDRLLSGKSGIRNTDGWLRPEAQVQLDSVSEEDVQGSRVLREVRNFATHESAESEARLTSTVSDLGKLKANFTTERRFTRRLLSNWLLSEDSRRLKFLLRSVIVAWRAMLAAEAVQDVVSEDF